MILLIDNYDSFVHNLARYFQRLGHADRRGPQRRPRPGRCRAVAAERDRAVARALHAARSRLLAGTGPAFSRDDSHAGRLLGPPGHRGGIWCARSCGLPEPMHGRVSPVFHDGQGVFAGLPNPFSACRYHSLVVDEATLPSCLAVSARTADGVVMAVRHRDRPLVGLQFHPESILTSHGYALLAAFLRLSGLSVPGVLPGMDEEGQEQERGRTQ